MALPTSILKFKSPGVKQILEIADNSPQATVPTGARILIINSRKGPVNKLVPVSDFQQYKTYFDDISDADERKGNWSARSAEYMLNTSPIYVLNLRKFDDTLDTAGLQEISSKVSVLNSLTKTKPYKKLFNTQQFWKNDPKQLIDSSNVDKMLVFGNIGAKNVSIFVRKSRTNQYNQTFDVWYKNLGREMPSYVNPKDKVNDWMVDVMIFNNTFNAASASNVNYGYCFNADGTVKNQVVNSSNVLTDGLEQLSAITESNHAVTFTGSLVNGFANESGNVIDIVSIVNSYSDATGIIVARNEELFDEAAIWVEGEEYANDGKKRPIPVDFKGHSICHINEVGSFKNNQAIQTVECLSYSYIVTENIDTYDMKVNDSSEYYLPLDVDSSDAIVRMRALLKGSKVGDNVIFSGEKNKFYISGDSLKPKINDQFVGQDGNLVSVTKVTFLGNKNAIYNMNTNLLAIQPFGEDSNFAGSKNWQSADGTSDDFTYTGAGTPFPKDPTGTFFVYPSDHILADLPVAYDEEILVNGQTILTGVIHNPHPAGTYFIDPNAGMTLSEFKDELSAMSSDYSPTTTKQIVNEIDISKERLIDANLYEALKTENAVVERVYEIETDGNIVVNVDNDPNIGFEYSDSFAVDNNTVFSLDNAELHYVYDNSGVIFKVRSTDELTEGYKPFSLKAYVPRQQQFLNGTKERQAEVLDVLTETSISNGLLNQDLTDWMYLVDGFKSYIEPNVKYQLKDVAKKRITGRAIYNLPTMYDFANSTNPYFKETMDGDLEIKYIPLGGNLELPHNNTFSLPSVDGYFAYGFGPGLTLSGTDKIMPPAAVVSNLFTAKHLSGKPYIITAGNPNGLIREKGISGTEYVFVEKNDGTGDRDYLDPFGFNLIVNKKNSGGLQLYSNKTSYNTVDSPIGSIHTSELVMYLQLRIKSLLERYVFQYNTAQNRLIIKTQADGICQEPLNAGALQRFLNVMDETNNTAEVIANRIGILDTTIWANNGMEILVHRTKVDTLTNTATFEIL